jgi:DNA-binding CsgD family transcriptional regulator
MAWALVVGPLSTEAITQTGLAQPRRLLLEPWRDAVRVSRFALGLIELPSTRFIELSPPAKELLGPGTDGARGLDFMDATERVDAEQIVNLASAGALDGTQSRRRWRRMDGSTAEVRTWGRVIRRTSDHDIGLWVAHELTPRSVEHGVVFSLPDEQAPRSPGGQPGPRGDSVAQMDPRWHISAITNAEDVLGHSSASLTDSALLDLTHPDDVPALLFAMARATSDLDATLGMRLRHLDGHWSFVEVTVTLREAEQPFELELTLGHRAPDSATEGGRLAELSAHLRRIAAELHSAEVAARRGSGADDAPMAALDLLSPRQAEILHRLLGGERVPMIAREMFLSASTVRNHLSMIFRKFGVHSQQELLMRLRRDGAPGGS